MQIAIEPIRDKDFDALATLFLEFATFEKLPDKMVNSADKMRKEKEFLHGFIARDEHHNIAGYVNYFFAYYTWTGKSLYMDDLYVREKYRGRGIGTLLINNVIEFAKKKQCNGVRWQVSSWNQPAIQFYEKLGAKINRMEMNCDLIF